MWVNYKWSIDMYTYIACEENTHDMEVHQLVWYKQYGIHVFAALSITLTTVKLI